MDNQGSSSGDRLRTTWTIAMDRYFVDIMLEQVHKGFKHRSSFTRKAWEDMVTLINKKFGLHLDKEILQNRSKKFKQQYNTIKFLLQSDGFHWDDTRQMIVADDNIWDEYLKAHPEAKSLRTRSVPHYNNFCLIYGEESASQLVKVADDTTVLPLDYRDPCGVRYRSSEVEEEAEKQAPSSNDRLRTTWTPTMDRYFIEIMMEAGVVKDVLKNRMKKLRLRYYTMKTLLDHGGFCWDETRQMITADDHVWDDYIKAHPEARPYRTITVPDYANLSVIFGNEHSKGRSNSTGRSVELINGMPEVKTGRESGGSQSPTISASHGDQCAVSLLNLWRKWIRETAPATEHSKTSWTPPMDRYFIEIMLEQISQGNSTGSTFQKEAWAHMLELFNSKFGMQLDKETLRVRLRKLRMQYNAMKHLLDHGGFCWDETRQMVVANDNVWDNYLKAHPEARSYRTKTLPNYNDLCVIYGNPSADGRHSCLGHNMDFNDTSGKKIVVLGNSVGDIQESSSHSGGGADTSNQLGKRPTRSFTLPSSSSKISDPELHSSQFILQNLRFNNNGERGRTDFSTKTTSTESTLQSRSPGSSLTENCLRRSPRMSSTTSKIEDTVMKPSPRKRPSKSDSWALSLYVIGNGDDDDWVPLEMINSNLSAEKCLRKSLRVTTNKFSSFNNQNLDSIDPKSTLALSPFVSSAMQNCLRRSPRQSLALAGDRKRWQGRIFEQI
ncbi:hypothetical protein F0562_007032 [Nyssa sinensis]|uniref:Myb/SANT-like domain-containing protein n=1 Tax=Nyssa sinensis TaxID=561372 RepID=A0A5J5A4N0_9ASTE|nr:hypothetical protein F0562_007032 [Nyssa sinensis]